MRPSLIVVIALVVAAATSLGWVSRSVKRETVTPLTTLNATARPARLCSSCIRD